MMRSNPQTTLGLALAAVFIFGEGAAFAQKKGGGGSGGAGAAYTIIDLPSPYHAADGNWSRTGSERISPVDPATGVVYVSGHYERTGSVPAGLRRSCLWAVSDAGNVAVADLDGVIAARDVNAAGIVCGAADGLPAVWHSRFGVVTLPISNEGGVGWVKALNDPDETGVFQVVGSQEVATAAGSQIQGVVWTVTLAGAVVSTTSVGDLTGAAIYPSDINNAGVISGLEYVDGRASPLVAWFDEAGSLQVESLPSPDPDAILYWRDLQIDHSGNVVGDGAEPVTDGIGEYPRAVIWPADGPVVSLSSLVGGSSAYGRGIATVAGVMQVAGSAWTRNTGWYATLYSSGMLTDLTKVSKGSQSWSLYEGFGVNRAGWICGRGRVGPSRSVQHHAYVLIPNTP